MRFFQWAGCFLLLAQWIMTVVDVPSSIIEGSMKHFLGIDKPHNDQCEAINAVVRSDPHNLLYIAPPGWGKSAVYRTAGAMLRGVTLVIVPVLSLQADQYAQILGQPNAEAIYMDDIKTSVDAQVVTKKLLSMEQIEPTKRQSVFLFASPQCLTDKEQSKFCKQYQKLLVKLAKKGILRLLEIDEVHAAVQHGLTFRKAFKDVGKYVTKPLHRYKNVRFMFTTATMTQERKIKAQKMFGIKFTKTIWPPAAAFDKRQHKIELKFRKNYFSQDMKEQIVPVLEKKDDSQIMILCERKGRIATITDHVYDTCANVLGAEHEQVVLELHGDLKACDKILNTNLFCSRINDPFCRQCNILVATSDTANAGLNPAKAVMLLREGPPRSLYNLVQELGRLFRQRGINLDTQCIYRMVFSLTDYSIMLCQAFESKQQFVVDDLNEFIDLVVSRDCWPHRCENKFGRPGVANTLPSTCGGNCPACSGEIAQLDLPVNEEKLKNILRSIFLEKSPRMLDPDFADSIHKNKSHLESIFGVKSVKKYHVEFLVLKLIVRKTITCKLERRPRTGKDKPKKTIFVRLAPEDSPLKAADRINEDNSTATTKSRESQASRVPFADIRN